jgi:hypothetical protein
MMHWNKPWHFMFREITVACLGNQSRAAYIIKLRIERGFWVVFSGVGTTSDRERPVRRNGERG